MLGTYTQRFALNLSNQEHQVRFQQYLKQACRLHLQKRAIRVIIYEDAKCTVFNGVQTGAAYTSREAVTAVVDRESPETVQWLTRWALIAQIDSQAWENQ